MLELERPAAEAEPMSARPLPVPTVDAVERTAARILAPLEPGSRWLAVDPGLVDEVRLASPYRRRHVLQALESWPRRSGVITGRPRKSLDEGRILAESHDEAYHAL